VICRPKKEGGLGVRDLRLVNISLLAKWKWKLLSQEVELWKEVVVARYGSDVMGKRRLDEFDVSRIGSTWWKDLCLLDKDANWFNSAIGKRVGSGNLTSFWNEQWIGDQSLRQRFPRLFGISMQKEEVISNLGSLIEGRWQWELLWRRNLFVWEEEQYRQFREIIDTFMPTIHNDSWLWMGDDLLGFTANSAFLLLVKEFNPPELMEATLEIVFKNLWKCGAPSKVCAFSWQLILDRIQTKDNLVKHRIINEQQGQCVLCGSVPETAIHLFLHCNFAAAVWYGIMCWLGFIIVLPNTIVSSLAVLLNCAKSKNQKRGLCFIWNVYMWTMWRVRNDRIFNNVTVSAVDVIDQIKLLSWKWFIGRIAKGPFLLYEWNWDPLECM
jgi:hypothetical protein